MSWFEDVNQARRDEREGYIIALRENMPFGPLRFWDQYFIDLYADEHMAWMNRVVFGEGRGQPLGFLGTADVESDQGRDADAQT